MLVKGKTRSVGSQRLKLWIATLMCLSWRTFSACNLCNLPSLLVSVIVEAPSPKKKKMSSSAPGSEVEKFPGVLYVASRLVSFPLNIDICRAKIDSLLFGGKEDKFAADLSSDYDTG